MPIMIVVLFYSVQCIPIRAESNCLLTWFARPRSFLSSRVRALDCQKDSDFEMFSSSNIISCYSALFLCFFL